MVYLRFPSLWPKVFVLPFSVTLTEVDSWLAVLLPYMLHIKKMYRKTILL